MSHAPEPWREGIAGNLRLYAADGHGGRSGPILEALPRAYTGEDRANLARAAICVNACDGLSNEQVASIQRLIACFTGRVDGPDLGREHWDLREIFPRQSHEPQPPIPAPPADSGWRIAMCSDRETGLDIKWTCPKCGLGPVNYRDSNSDYADTFYHCLACDKHWCVEGADA